MAPPYSNGFAPAKSRRRSFDFSSSSRSHRDVSSLARQIPAGLVFASRSAWAIAKGPGRRMAIAMAWQLLRQLRRNLVARRLLSFPHLLAAFWIVILLWGERWVFQSRVEKCEWSNWENWVSLLDGPPHPPTRWALLTARAMTASRLEAASPRLRCRSANQ